MKAVIWKLALGWATAAVLLILPWWPGGDGAPGVSPAQANVRLLMPVKKKPEAKDFELKDLKGRSWKLSDLKGKVVVINFWATSCPVCRVEMPSLQGLWRELRKVDVQVLTIHKGGSEEDVRAFAQKYHLQLPILLDLDEKVSKEWGVFRLPITFVLDTDGRLAFIAFGGRNWRNPQIMRIIMSLLPPL